MSTDGRGIVAVDVEQLDRLVSLVVELAVLRSTFADQTRQARDRHGFKQDVLQLIESGEHVGRIAGQIQAKIIKAGLLPARTVPALLVTTGDEVYALPQEYVQEVVRALPGQISHVEGRDRVAVRSTALPLVHLSEIVGAKDSRASESLQIVIVCGKDRQIGLAVDQVFGRSEILLKEMGRRLPAVRGLAGASISGDGRVVMVLDAAVLCDEAI